MNRLYHFAIGFLLFGLSIPFLQAQQTSIKSPSDFYPKDRAQVLVVGSFHFNFPGLDTHKTDDAHKIDVLKEPKKSELEELVAYIKQFKPTKVAIEAKPSWNSGKKYEAYKNGKYRDLRDETFLIGMRIAMDMGLDTVYGIDARSLNYDLYQKDSVFLGSLFDKVDWDTPDPYWEKAEKYMAYEDDMMKKTTLLNFFRHMNSREIHNTNFGLYLTGAFASGEGQGADKLSIWWYNRNARIFANLINITEGPEDRILVLFGNGHAAILRQFLEASPQYEFVEFSSL
ncbi:MAG: DUF5694 domain-containing protein [Flavobacteriaceae bacterium]